MRFKNYIALLVVPIVFCITANGFVSNEIKNSRVLHRVEKRSMENAEEEVPLPSHVTPNSYKLQLQPFPHEGYFQGKVEIIISCHMATDIIILNAHSDLHVALLDTTVHSIDHRNESVAMNTFKQVHHTHHYERIPLHYTPHSVAISKASQNSNKDWYQITLEEKLNKDMMYLIKLEFLGNLTLGERGAFYQMHYGEIGTNEEGWYIAMNLKRKNVKKVFPCFDDPSFKANIHLSVVIPKSLAAFSTMPLQSTETIKDGWKIHHFGLTPPMAVQSLGLIILNPTQIEPIVTEKVFGYFTVHAYGSANIQVKEQFQLRMKQIISCLHVLEEYTGNSFPLPELRFVAVPAEVKEMVYGDHWGLIIFSDRELHPDTVTFVPFFSLATQWLDHVVTPIDSDEGFNPALYLYLTFISFSGDLQETEMNREQIDWITSLAPGALGNPLIQNVWMLRMLNYTIGKEAFRQGLQNFLKDRAFKTYTKDDLFNALNEQAIQANILPRHTSVQLIAKSWIDNNGMPVVAVTRNYEDRTAVIEQHILVSKDRDKDETKNARIHLFWIPIMYISNQELDVNSMETVLWMKDEQTEIHNLPLHDSYIILNPEFIAGYLVNYDQTNWHLLAQYLIESATNGSLPLIPEMTRSKLLLDAMTLALGGELEFTTALDMTLFLRCDESPQVWHIMNEMYDEMMRLLYNTPVYDKFLIYCRYLYSHVYKYFEAIKSEGERTNSFLKEFNTIAALVGYEPAVRAARIEFHMSLKANTSIQSKRKCAVIRWSDGEWELLLQEMLNFVHRNESAFKSTSPGTITCNRKPDKLKRILNIFLLEKTYTFSDGDVEKLLYGISNHNALLKFISDNWTAIKIRFGDKPNLWNTLFKVATRYVKTQEDLILVSQLYHEHYAELQNAAAVVGYALEEIREGLNGKYKKIDVINNWLDLHLATFSIISS